MQWKKEEIAWTEHCLLAQSIENRKVINLPRDVIDEANQRLFGFLKRFRQKIKIYCVHRGVSSHHFSTEWNEISFTLRAKEKTWALKIGFLFPICELKRFGRRYHWKINIDGVFNKLRHDLSSLLGVMYLHSVISFKIFLFDVLFESSNQIVSLPNSKRLVRIKQ